LGLASVGRKVKTVPALLIPADWSVVVVGRWNRAILTPAGIGKRVLGVDAGTPLEVMVAIDAIAPPLVKHDKMTVVADSDRLTIQLAVCAFDELVRACSLARNALKQLPETPLAAVGFNVRYIASDFCEALDAVLKSDLDDRASDAGYRILDRQNRKLSDEKSPAGKTDYHTMGACHEVLRLLRSQLDAPKD